MSERFIKNCDKLFCAIASYILSGLTDNDVSYDSSAGKEDFVKTVATSEANRLPSTGLPIRGNAGTSTRWEERLSDRAFARKRAFIALNDDGNRTYIKPSVPYQAIVESVRTAYDDLAAEIVSDFVLSKILFESVGRKYFEPSELTSMTDRIADDIRGVCGKIIISGLIGNILADAGYIDSEHRQFSSWGEASRRLAIKLSSLSTREHHEYTIVVLLNAPLLDSRHPIEIATLQSASEPLRLQLGQATDELLSLIGNNKEDVSAANTVLTMTIRIGVCEPVEQYLLLYQFAEIIAQKGVDILRLVSADDIGVLGVKMIRGDSMTPFIDRTWASPYDQEFSAFYPRRFNFRSPSGNVLSNGDIETVRRLTEKHIMAEVAAPGWDIALRRFRDMYERYTSDDPETILTMAMLLEALYLSDLDSPKTELTYRLSLRVARFLRANAEERIELYDLIRDLYHFRSRIAHGGSVESLKAKERKKLDRILEVGPGVLRESLLAVLDGRGPWGKSAEKQRLAWRHIELG